MKITWPWMLRFGMPTLMTISLLSASLADTNAAWTTESTRTGPRGTSSMTATGSASRAATGTQWNVGRQGVTAGGQTWQSDTQGSGQRTTNGYAWSSTTLGSNDAGHTWTTERDGQRLTNADGTVTILRDASTTLDNGKTVSSASTTTVTQTDDGREWTTEGSRVGPRGTGTMSAAGSGSRTATGAVWKVDRDGTTAGGKDWTSHTDGSSSRTNGARRWNSTTQGSTESGKTWQTDRQGEAGTADGTRNVNRSSQTTGSDSGSETQRKSGRSRKSGARTKTE